LFVEGQIAGAGCGLHKHKEYLVLVQYVLLNTRSNSSQSMVYQDAAGRRDICSSKQGARGHNGTVGDWDGTHCAVHVFFYKHTLSCVKKHVKEGIKGSVAAGDQHEVQIVTSWFLCAVHQFPKPQS
jgi:hypothetical protein